MGNARRTKLLKGGSLAATSLLLSQSATAQADKGRTATPERPNVVFILADDMGYGDLSCYGSEHVQTPNIDRLAATGTRFNQCYAGSGISSPSRCALMTGLHSGHGRIRDNMCTAAGITGLKITPRGDTTIVRRTNLQPCDTTIATVLSAGGYYTGLVNKWHLDGYDPTAAPHHRGFNEFSGWLISTVYSNDPYYYPYWRFHDDHLVNIPENADGRHGLHNNDLSTRDAIEFIRRNKERPFFLFLAYDAPHEPYNIDQTAWYDGQEQWTPDTRRYASLITLMDQGVGRVVATLDSLGLRENTLVIFASDNGAAVQAPLKTLRCNAGFRGRKGQLYEGGIRVPLIVNQPGRVPVQSLENTVYFPDLMPTLADLTGCTAHLPQRTDGISLLPLWLGRKDKQADTDNRLLYWEFTGKQRAARRGPWKCVTIRPNAPLELYNLQEDPEERNNLASLHPEIVKQFDREMRLQHEATPCWPLPEELESTSRKTAEARQTAASRQKNTH